jgi:hypothetical protein
MKREHAKRLRALIEQTAVNLTDSEALTGIELFPLWNASASYQTGDRVRYSDTLYKCLQDHTAQADWKPSEAVSLWVRVDDPSIEFPAWIQPVVAQDAYPKGAKVSHLEKHWISDVDSNVWEPSVYGWSEI